MLALVPSFGAKLQDHREFTKAKVENRLNRKTDREDFMSYVRLTYMAQSHIGPCNYLLTLDRSFVRTPH